MGLLASLAAAKRTVWVAAAISLLPAMRDTADLFEQRNPGVEVAINSGSSGLLCQQMLRGAPADVFVSASPVEVDRLEAAGRLASGTRRTIASNRIIVVLPAGAEIPSTPAELVHPRYARIAMGNPSTAPVGRYAKRALQALELYEPLKPRLVLGENARQVLEYVARGEVDAALLYRSDARILPGKVEAGPELPADPEHPIEYQAVALSAAAQAKLAAEFLELIVSEEGQAILEQHGFIRTWSPAH
jgi:molybdate transport system substrate-binding protein